MPKQPGRRMRRGALARAVPPPDNPLARSQEHDVARLSGTADLELISVGDGMRVLVTERAMTIGAAAPAGPARRAEDPKRQMARLRLAALVEAKPVGTTALPGGGLGGAPGPIGVAPVPGASNWVQLGPTAIPKGQTYSAAKVLVTGRVTAIAVDPTDRNTIYVGTAQGGVWKSVDRGDHWYAMSDNEASLAIGALAIDPSDHNTIYAATGEGNFSGDSYYGAGVLRSTNGGANWTSLGAATFTGLRFSRFAVTPGTPARLFAATGAGLFRSTDTGATWSQLGGGLPAFNATDVLINPTTPTTVFAAFWSGGIYRSTNAGAASPTWTKLAGGLPASGFTRIALGISPTNPAVVYALLAGPGNAYLVNALYRSTDGGSNWTAIPLPGGNIGGQGFYNLNVAVDPTTPDIAYLSGVSLWRAVRNSLTGAWAITDIGLAFHPDNHAVAFDPTDALTIYAGSDGGIYRSTDRGATWSDAINRDFCITQFEFIDSHPTSEAIVLGGTQDNGTEQFRNSPVFYHSDDGDGGFCVIDQTDPRTFLSTYYGNSPKRSTEVGRLGSWLSVAPGIAGPGLFYPPLAADRTNPQNLAFGTDRLNLDPAQGAAGWPTKVALPGLGAAESVSAIHYANSSLIYAGTTSGHVYRATLVGGAWTATPVHAAPLPSQFIWDIGTRPGDPDTVFLVMSGFGADHVWRGALAPGAAPAWTSASGAGAQRLPDIPVNALAIDPAAPDTMYVATDVAVFRTTDGGGTWSGFSQGLPNCAVFDLRLHAPSRLLRAATHGRGLWERQLDAATAPDVRLFVRDNLLDAGRGASPSGLPAAFPDPLHGIALGDPLWWWQCADIKVDALEGFPPAYQMPPTSVDYVAFESALGHRNARRGQLNRVYVQLHNQGVSPAANVRVKLLWANAGAGLPPLPPDFWSAFPADSTNTADWHPIGTAQTVARIESYLPEVVHWDWSTPTTAADHSCLLVVVDAPGDPIPASSKVFDVDALVRAERRVGLKNLHVVDALPGTTYWTELAIRGGTKSARLRVVGRPKGWGVGFVLPKDAAQLELVGLTERALSRAERTTFAKRLGGSAGRYDTGRLLVANPRSKEVLIDKLTPGKRGTAVVVALVPPGRATSVPQLVSVVQEDGKGVVGGSSYVLRVSKAPPPGNG